MVRTWFEILLLYTLVLLVTRALCLMPGVVDLRRRSRLARPPAPPRRPLEVVADDVRRLGARYRHPPRGTSYAKLEALRYAYDHALSEACSCLEIEHLLEVLPPGEELDRERNRVEDALWLVGLRFPEAA